MDYVRGKEMKKTVGVFCFVGLVVLVAFLNPIIALILAIIGLIFFKRK
jgi:hypothetical protein